MRLSALVEILHNNHTVCRSLTVLHNCCSSYLFISQCCFCPQGHFIYVSNLEEYGHLLNGDNYNTDHVNNDMYMLFDNRLVRRVSLYI